MVGLRAASLQCVSAGPSCDQSPSNPNPGRSQELFMKQAVFHYSHECATPPQIPTLVNAILSQKSPTTPSPTSPPSPYPGNRGTPG